MPTLPRKISFLLVGDRFDRLKNRQGNLEAGFQRQFAWKDHQRQKLIKSVLSGYPLPAIFWFAAAGLLMESASAPLTES